MSKTGIIYGINGPVVYLKGDSGFKISEMVYVGKENLDCYSYDPQMYSMASYARYLFRELELNIDDPAFATFDFQGYGERQLGLLESVQTAYGMITRNEDFLIQAQQNTEQGMKMQ